MGGRQRYLGPDGKLEFHRYAFPGLTDEQDAETNPLGEDELVDAGATREFAKKVFSTPNASAWSPDAATLRANNVVTQVVDGLAFAAAAHGRPTAEETDRE